MKSNPESLVDRASGRNLPRSSSVRGVWPRLGYRIRIPLLMSGEKSLYHSFRPIQLSKLPSDH
jgi:hypothetical protein